MRDERYMNQNTRVILKQAEEREIQEGFPWVYANEIETIRLPTNGGNGIKTTALEGFSGEDGTVVDVFSSTGCFLGSGVLNRKSKITVRLISHLHADKVMEDIQGFWSKKIRDAVNIRRASFQDTESCRLVFGEADFVPGFVADRFVSGSTVYIVVQFLALACEAFRCEIISALRSCVKPDFIYERSDATVRQKEGLPLCSRWIGTKGSETVEIEENGLRFLVDIAHGQKTGFFLDQKLNRLKIRNFCHGKRVLDAFCHTGAFGLNAFAAGAKQVICADSSEGAIVLARKNIELNGATKRIFCVCADVFDLLKKYEHEGEKFDVIVLDPPAFALKANAESIKKAYGGYKEINLRAMRLLREGGVLATGSCSSYFDSNTFYSMLTHAAKDSRRRVQVLEKLGASGDHPVLLGYPKSEYLKFAICRVL